MADQPLEVPLIDLRAQRRRLGNRIDNALAAVLDHGQFILGPEVTQLEERLGEICGARHVVACSSGTDALLLILLAWGVGPGDVVLVPSFSFAATAEVVALIGATPMFVDVRPDTFTVDPERLALAKDAARGGGRQPVGVIAVDLFGQPADYEAVRKIAADDGMWILADAAQSLGGTLDGRPIGSLADATATSFFPAKPLGCYGDGGAVLTDDGDLAARLRSLRAHGRAPGAEDNTLVGTNSRLDTLQAAILLIKLDIFDDELMRREKVAARYADGLADLVHVPTLMPGATSAWACYTVRSAHRDWLRQSLRDAGIASAVYYPRPLHALTAYTDCPTAPGGLRVSEQLAREVLSLPMHPYLDSATQDRIIDAVRAALRTLD
jgi:dTDP-4-amino-4,6-dideoxygalactose transaminase